MSLVERIRAALELPPPHGLMNGDLGDDPVATGPATDAAVLVAITDRPDPGLVLTVRNESLRNHAGQVAFPGGRLDPGEDHVRAALREANEELGLDPGHVSLLGTADRYRTVTAFDVTPVIGTIPAGLDLSPHEPEVGDWFEAPLSFVLDRANQNRMSAEYQGRQRRYWQIDWQGRKIWGATAAMLVNLRLRLDALEAPIR